MARMSTAEKDAMEYLYCVKSGKRRRRGLGEPTDRTLDKLEDRGYIRTTASGNVKLTPWGKNVGRMIAGDM